MAACGTSACAGGAGGAGSAGSLPCLVCAAFAGEAMADEGARKETPWRFCNLCGNMYPSKNTPICLACIDSVKRKVKRPIHWYKHRYDEVMECRAKGCHKSEADEHDEYEKDSDDLRRDEDAYESLGTLCGVTTEYANKLKYNARGLLHWDVLPDDEELCMRAELRDATTALIKLHTALRVGMEKYKARLDEVKKMKKASRHTIAA